MKLLVYIEPTSYVVDLCRELAKQGPADQAIVFLGENRTQSWDVDLSNLPNARVLRGSPAGRMLVLARLVLDHRVRLLHLAGWSGPYLLCALALAVVRGVPVGIETDTQRPREEPWIRRAAKRLLFPPLFSMVTRFFPAGRRQAAYLRLYGVPDRRITVAQMTVDVAAIAAFTAGVGQARRRELRDELCGAGTGASTVFLCVSRLEPYKGIGELLRAFSSVTADARLVIVGDGSMRDQVAAAAAADPRVLACGRRSGEALLACYACADALVVPSLADQWGLVVNEGMAAGLPVIATDAVGATDDLVEDGESGFVVAAGDPAALAGKMSVFCGDAALRQRMGSAGRALISRWTISDEAGILLEAWREMEAGCARSM
jgi:glycosyltransferase involved in cell wall biosynthesis